MKIAVISNGAQSLMNFRGPLMAEMIRRGHEVIAFAPDHNAGTRRDLEAIGVRPMDLSMTRSGTGPIREFASIILLARLLRTHRPDLCFAYFLKPVIYGTIAAWLAGVRRRFGLVAGLGVAFGRSADGAASGLLNRVMSGLARFAFDRIDLLMFQNIDDLEELTRRNLVKRGKAALTGATGVDLEEWSNAPLPNGPLTFVLAARLLREKGVSEYAQAARAIKSRYPDTKFVLLGGVDDNPASFTAAEVERWVSDGLVEWPGHVPVAPWLARAHVFVLPSYYREGVPRSSQEAMAMGRPVITTNCPGCRETVVDGVNGFIIPPRNSVALAEAMVRFIEEPHLIAKMGKESRRLAEERFDVHHLNEKLLGLIGL